MFTTFEPASSTREAHLVDHGNEILLHGCCSSKKEACTSASRFESCYESLARASKARRVGCRNQTFCQVTCVSALFVFQCGSKKASLEGPRQAKIKFGGQQESKPQLV